MTAIETPLVLSPGPANIGNRRSCFFDLADGRLMLLYSYYYGDEEKANDHSPAYIVARYSDDGGSTWSNSDDVVLENEADMNTVSTSLLRLADGTVALFYSRKNSLSDCLAYVRFSTDECQTWSEAVLCIPDEPGYYVVNNDRVVRLASGRILLPTALHKGPNGEFVRHGQSMCYLSDDDGHTWRRSRTVLDRQLGSDRDTDPGLQEPGVVPLRDGRLMMFMRGGGGCQYLSYSDDGGDTWSAAQASDIASPLSPASIKRIPSTDDLLMVWNNNGQDERRTPLTVAVSGDDGQSWEHVQDLFTDPIGHFCYTAIHFTETHVLLGHTAGQRPGQGLNILQITRFPIERLYARR